MISLPKKVIDNSRRLHSEGVVKIIDLKVKILTLCLEYYQLQSKVAKDEFKDKLFALKCDDAIKRQSLNWFLKKSTSSKDDVDGEFNNVKSINNLTNYFDSKKRIVSRDFTTQNELRKRLEYFKRERIHKIINGGPSDLLEENERYKKYFPENRRKDVNNQILKLLTYLFDYVEFSKKESIFSPHWGAYQLTSSLNVNTCLYCNRNYVITVINSGKNFIRAEIDHFFAQSSYPILALSFYNLIPSCHICNSNLKKATNISLINNLHPYVHNYCDEKVKFTYKVNNPRAFFHDTRGLSIILDTSKTIRMKTQIDNNIELFKLDYIYDHHKDIAEGLMDLQRKTVPTRLQDIYANILINNSGKKIFDSEKDLYEFAIRNYFSPAEFYKRPLAKFEKDIAKEIGLI
ncbi:hypothetical protein [Flavobacterium panacagri]|uniref:hypothetical protein n=1 Tax=Flavobacterium panacagri TaxID=3034146 RepID=UPI0025A64AF6|nr:hypothetical protein [Flavobacterium panacagri]